MNYFWAFCVGGALCVAGQLLIDLTKLTPARILVAFVVAGVVLSALGWYAPLAEFAGAGATVPLLGFGHLLAQGVVNAVNKSGLLGVLTGRPRGQKPGPELSPAFAGALRPVGLLPRGEAPSHMNFTVHHTFSLFYPGWVSCSAPRRMV